MNTQKGKRRLQSLYHNKSTARVMDACPEGDVERRKGVSMGRQRRNKTTPEKIGCLKNLLRADPAKETFTGLLNPSQGAENLATPVVDNR